MLAPRNVESGGPTPAEWNGRSVDAGGRPGQEHRGKSMREPPHRVPPTRDEDRHEPEQTERAEDDSTCEEESAPWLAPHEREPAERDESVGERQTERHVPERENGHRESERKSQANAECREPGRECRQQ